MPRITFDLEFEYNQAGLSGSDWKTWFMLGSHSGVSPQIPALLWYVREFAADQQDLASRTAVFLRADWVDAFVPKLDLSGFVVVDPLDGSRRFQLSADELAPDR